MTRSALPTIGAAAAVVLAVPLFATATTAAWVDAEWVHGQAIGTGALDCDDPPALAGRTSSRFLGGRLLGLDLGTVAELSPLIIDREGADVDVDPPDAVDLGSTASTAVYANPLQISALGGLAAIDLTGLQVGLPVGSAGAVNQYGRVSIDGQQAAASGLVSNSGGVLVSDDTPDAELPEPARVTLDDFLPALTGVAGVDLEVGAVASSAQLDGCEALLSQIWGDGQVTGVVRDYGIAGLGLDIDSPLTADLVAAVNDAVADVGAAVDTLVGTSGVLSTSLRSGIDVAVPAALDVTALSGTISITGLNLPASVNSLLTTPLTDGVVTIDLANGAVQVDLAALVDGPDGINDLAPNTELVLNADVLGPLTTRVGALLDSWTTNVENALRAAVRGATLTINSSSTVRLLGGLDVLRANLSLTASIGDVLDGNAALSVSASALGTGAVLNPLLASLGVNLAGLLGIVDALDPTLNATVVNNLTSVALGAITTAGGSIADAAQPLLTALDTLVDALPDVLSVMVNVQPDQPGAPSGIPVDPGPPGATPSYSVSALRISLVDALSPGGVASVSLATSTVGQVRIP